MHLLQVQAGEIGDGVSPVDLAQSPAEIIVISAADTEIAALAAAREQVAEPSLRLANLAHLTHPYTIDRYLDTTATRARLVVVRILGGQAYWPYGLEQFAARLHASGVAFAALPGDDRPEDGLRQLSSVSDADYDALWACLVEGGPDNTATFLRHARALLEGTPRPPAARPLLRAGVYFPGDSAAAGVADLDSLRAQWQPGAPVVAVVFYRALLQGAGLHPVNRLVRALLRRGLNPLPVFVASLKDDVSAATLSALFSAAPPAVVLNATAFAVSSPGQGFGGTVLDAPGAPVLQIVFSGGSEEAWEKGTSGLSARDIAMNVSLPEIDGRILTRALSFKAEAWFDEATECLITTYRAHGERIEFVVELAQAWARLAASAPGDRRVALVLANYPNRDGRLANGVGLDTPAATVSVLRALAGAGYGVTGVPEDSDALMRAILAGPTNWLTDRASRQGGARLSLADYHLAWGRLPADLRQKVTDRWGPPEADPFFVPGEVDCGSFALSILQFGNVVVGVQPARGYNINPKDSYHSPDLIPPHNYFAFYVWLRGPFAADAVVHMGKHGNLEWLPGKALALSASCAPEAVLGPMPHVYPFIVNDPGEGTQAKRRAQAVIIDHLTPPLTRAETYGPLRELESLVDEYYEAAQSDPRRTLYLRRQILGLTEAHRLDLDAGIAPDADEADKLQQLDAYLCDLKEAQIRDGLHVFGTSPQGVQARDLALALLRAPRGTGAGDASIIRALAADLGLAFDPLDCDMAAPWTGPRPPVLSGLTTDAWRSTGDVVERLELLAAALLDGAAPAPEWTATLAVLDSARTRICPALEECGPAEMAGLLRALDGRFVPPGPSGAPTRGRPDVLPTGRNFYSIDSRTLPTPTAWALGWTSASRLVERHVQDHGDWPRAMVLTAWGTANMRTGGDDLAQALALMGARPQWDSASRRVTGFEILPASVLGRPRVDVTLRVSGFFRDAFPAQIDLIDSAARAIMALDEPSDINPAAARWRSERAALGDGPAGARVFGSRPGAYGAGLQALIDERLWNERADLGRAYLEWGGYAYGNGAEGAGARAALETRLSQADAVVQNQDNREHDLLDSDDYYQFEGGAAAAIEHLSGRAPVVYHNDHSRPERPVIRTLDEEIGRVMRARVVNPKWIAGVMRHGYKGAFEMAATTDYLFAFAATTHAVRSHHFDLLHSAFLEDEAVRSFIDTHNPDALREIAARLTEAIERGMWQPRSNSARAMLHALLN